jgi:hypothetical protein
MQVNYKVHSVGQTKTPVKVKYNDNDVEALIPSVEVELTSDAGFTHTFRFTDPADVAEVSAWVPNQEVTVQVTAGAAPPPPAKEAPAAPAAAPAPAPAPAAA